MRGVVLVVLATLCFIVMNGSAKYLAWHLPVVEIIWARSLGHLILVVVLFGPRRGGWGLLTTSKPVIQLSRSLLHLISNALFFSAIGLVPLADATSVSFTAPLMVVALARPLLGERVHWTHWLAIGAGFFGALILIRPTGDGINPYLLLILGSSACSATYQILTRKLAGIDSPETSVTYTTILGAVVFSAMVPFWWRPPTQLTHWFLLGALGLLGGIGHYCVARALSWAPASVVSPFYYVQLVWASALGYLIFGDVPSGWTWLGAVIIITSGLYIAWRATSRSDRYDGKGFLREEEVDLSRVNPGS